MGKKEIGRGKKGEGKKERREINDGKKSPNAGFEPATFCSAVHVTTIRLPPPDIRNCTCHVSVDFHDL